MFKLIFILAFGFAIPQYVRAVCNVCNPNGVACISANEFHPCFNGEANTAMKFSCLQEDEVCTKNPGVCKNKNLNSTTPACGNISNCGTCKDKEDDGRFTCTSRTTFSMCFGGALSQIRDTCPENQICDVGLGKSGEYPCVPSCRESEIEICDLSNAIDVPTTTAAMPSTATTELTSNTKPSIATTTQVGKTTTRPQSTTTPQLNVTTTTKISTTTKITTTKFSPTPPTETTTTLKISTTSGLPLTTQNPAELVCSRQSAAGRYPYPNDTTCQRYILCHKQAGFMPPTVLKCPTRWYFSPSLRACVKVKPAGCN